MLGRLSDYLAARIAPSPSSASSPSRHQIATTRRQEQVLRPLLRRSLPDRNRKGTRRTKYAFRRCWHASATNARRRSSMTCGARDVGRWNVDLRWLRGARLHRPRKHARRSTSQHAARTTSLTAHRREHANRPSSAPTAQQAIPTDISPQERLNSGRIEPLLSTRHALHYTQAPRKRTSAIMPTKAARHRR